MRARPGKKQAKLNVRNEIKQRQKHADISIFISNILILEASMIFSDDDIENQWFQDFPFRIGPGIRRLRLEVF